MKARQRKRKQACLTREAEQVSHSRRSQARSPTGAELPGRVPRPLLCATGQASGPLHSTRGACFDEGQHPESPRSHHGQGRSYPGQRGHGLWSKGPVLQQSLSGPRMPQTPGHSRLQMELSGHVRHYSPAPHDERRNSLSADCHLAAPSVFSSLLCPVTLNDAEPRCGPYGSRPSRGSGAAPGRTEPQVKA